MSRALTQLTTRGGFPARIEEARRGDDSAALLGSVNARGTETGVVWRRDGTARWLTEEFDLAQHDVDATIRNHASDD